MTGAARRQRGQALLVMLLILALGASWFLVRRLDAVAGSFTATDRAHNAEVLNRAKQALIGYVAAQAAKSFEDNPGALPCPEHPWYINRTSPDDGMEGTMGPAIGVSNPGGGTANCSSIGRYPWRSIGTPMPVDAAGEPLWYVVGSTWRKTSTSTKTVINSNTAGDVTLDGQSVVALIIAPGNVMNAAAGTTPTGVGCAARNQARSSPLTYAVDPLDYIECYNSATLQFSATGSSAATNDQVVTVTVADLMPGIEAAVANRIEREIVPVIKSIYAAPSWGLTGSSILYPFAAPFADPSTSSMQGAAGTYGGLLPFSYAETTPGGGTACTPGVSAPRCSPSFVSWSSATLSAASIYSPNCTTTATQVDCTYYYWCLLVCPPTTTFNFTLTATASNVGMAMRTFNTAATMTNVSTTGRSASGVMNSNGSATVTLTGTMNASSSGTFLSSLLAQATCLLTLLDLLTYGCMPASISVPIALLADHPILDSTTATSYSWFVRNKWHELAYYALAPNYSPGVMPTQPSCTTGGNCLSVANVSPAGGQRAILILAGRSINGTARPSGTLANYLESGNATGSYTQLTVSAGEAVPVANRSNDRVIVAGSN